MPLENTARGCSSAMTSVSGSTMAGRSQTNYGLSIVDRPDAAPYRAALANHTHRNRHEDRTDHRLLLRLRTRDSTPLPRAGLEGRRHHAKPARRPAAALRADARAATRRDERTEH